MMMKSRLSFIVALGCFLQVSAQEFTCEAKIEGVESEGYHRVELSPELLGSTTSRHTDLRIYDELGNEQPYLLTQEAAISISSLFTEYEIIDQKYKEDTISHVTFHNPTKEAINNVSFVVKNTDVQKRARLSGSDDGENWFIIKDNYLLHSMHNEKETTELKILDFPLSDYEFFRLDINDNWRLPINILKVGFYDTQKIVGKETTFNAAIVSQKDSAKTSYVKVRFDVPVYLEQLKVNVSGAEYYSRETRLLVKKETVDRKGKKSYYFNEIGSMELNSNSSNEVELRGEVFSEIYIEIENRDNAPLKVERITGSFLNKYAVVNLAPTKSYVLKWGDENLHSPDYDIVNFADRIPEDATRIKHASIQKLVEEEVVEKKKGIFENPYIIWAVIGLVGLVLGFVSLRMVKEIGQK